IDPFPGDSAAAPATVAAPAVEPVPVTETTAAAPAAEPPPPTASVDEAGAPAADRPARKRAPKKPTVETVADLPLGLSSDEPSDEAPMTNSDGIERVITSDGATRLIATAYIGIGNRLFIRGEGPGLSWEKGVPLQFVSIGKWRWETADATATIKFKLFKN